MKLGDREVVTEVETTVLLAIIQESREEEKGCECTMCSLRVGRPCIQSHSQCMKSRGGFCGFPVK